MAEPIKIIITQGGQGGSPATGESGGKSTREASTEYLSKGKLPGATAAPSAFNKAIVGASVTLAMGSINYGLSNYGNMTGNYVAQDKINEVREVVNTVTGIAGFSMSAGISAALLGGTASIAAPVAAVVAVAGVAVKIGTNIATYNLNVKKQTTRTEYLRQLTGNPEYNGSRGTNN